MIHFKILTHDEYTDKRFEQAKYLIDSDSVEREFISIVNSDREAFRDEISCRILKELDSSYRENDYGVVTPKGKSCITCLSTKIKTTLLICYFNSHDIDVFAPTFTLKYDVWKWLGDNVELLIYMRELDLCSFSVFYFRSYREINSDFEYKGEMIEENDISFSKEIEKIMFNEKFKDKTKFKFHRTENITMGDFVLHFQNSTEANKELCYCRDVHYIEVYDYTVTIPNRFFYVNMYYSYPKTYSVVTYKSEEFYKDDECFFNKSSLLIHKTFLDVLIGIFTLDYCNFHEMTGVVMDGNDDDINKNYIEHVKWGYYVNTEEKKIIIYDAQQAVINFHEAFQKMKESEEDDYF